MKNKKLKVFVTRQIPNAGLNLLKKFYNVRIYPNARVIQRKELIKGVKWCDALLCLLTDKIDANLMDQNPNLRVIANYAVGYNNIDIDAATKRNIAIINTPGVLTDAVAEHTFALMLAITKRICEADKFTRAGKYKGWEPMLLLGSQLKGKTLGIVGLGRIGVGVAQRAVKGMGMNVIYSDVNKHPKFDKKFNAKQTTLKQLLKSADIITLHVPLLKSTKHLISKKEFKLMKPTSFLINTSRGPVIDEKALLSALQKKSIAGVALDVFENEPKLTQGLNKLNNVLLTPHIASATIQARQAMSKLVATGIISILNKKKPTNLINKNIKFKK